jgi:hypothetical protein
MIKAANGLLTPSGFAIAGLIVAVACGGKPAEAPPLPAASPEPVPVASAPSTSAPAAPSAEAPSPPPATPTANTPTPLASVLTTDPTTIQKLFDDTSHASAATLKTKGASSDDPLAKGLREFAKKVAPGMNPDGPLAIGKLEEKQSLQAQVTLQPGKCYTIVGYSKKVKDLDLYLLLAPGILSGQDTTDDNTPFIGGGPQPMCPVAVTAVTYILGIVADEGAGDVAVQLYSKGK